MWTTIISPLCRSLRLIRLILPRVFSLLFLVPCFARSHDLPLEALRLPPGFQISVFAELTNPRQLALSESGIVYAGSFRAGNLYGVIDANSDGSADKVATIDHGLTLPTGIAIQDGDLYVGAVNKLLVYQNIDQTFESSPEPFVLYDELPEETHHGWKYLGFSPEDNLFFNVGAPCNVCETENPWFATIMSLDLDREPLQPEIFTSGVRNTAGFTWHPGTGATTILIDGWLKNNVAWGRPTDILEMPDGSLLIADDHANVIYRLTYETP